MQCVNLGDTEALLLLLLLGLTTSAALRFLAVAISAALLLRHLVRLFWNQTCLLVRVCGWVGGRGSAGVSGRCWGGGVELVRWCARPARPLTHLDLGLGHGELISEFGALGPSQVLGLLERLLQHVDLVAREGWPRVLLALVGAVVAVRLLLAG